MCTQQLLDHGNKLSTAVSSLATLVSKGKAQASLLLAPITPEAHLNLPSNYQAKGVHKLLLLVILRCQHL